MTSDHIKHAQADYEILPLLAQRWSPRAYADRPVEDEKLCSVLEAARWASSSGNGQPWRFIMARREDADEFARMVACLADGNKPWAAKAPVLMVVVAQTVRDNGRPARHAWYDLGLAVQNLAIQATALGLSLRQMAGFSADRAREIYAIPEYCDAVVMLAIGYRGEPDSLNENHLEQEQLPRSRRPLQEIVFAGTWGETAPLIAK